MMDGLMALGRFAAGAVWAPMGVWTVAAGVGVVVLRRQRGVHPLVRYRLGQALLFALPLALLVGWGTPVGQGVEPVLSPAPVQGSARDAVAEHPVIGSPRASVAPGVDLPVVFSGLAAAGALLLAAFHLVGIPLRLRALGRIGASARPVADPASHEMLERLRRRLGVRRPVALVQGGDGSVPMTFGWRRPVIVIPAALVDRPDELRMTLVHELIHVARHDFAWAVAESSVRALFAFHPLVRLLTRDVERHREASCDLEVLATREARAGEYAGLLFTLGARVPPHYGLAAGLATPVSHLRERIETMKNFENRASSSGLGTGLAAAALLAGTALLGACFSFNESVVEGEAVEAEPVVVGQVAGVGTVDGSMSLDRLISVDQSVSVAGTASLSQATERALARLDAQIGYLSAEIDQIDARFQAAQEARARGEATELTRRLMTRAGLLHDLYEERVREYELLKLELVGASTSR